MTLQDVQLSDRYDLEKNQILLNGSQALVRMMLMQSARDRKAGHHTAGYVTGYRGSPLGAVDFQMERAEAQLGAADITFQPGLNEDLAATALWGAQQAELRGEGRFDGVFGLWYGKGPGVDRSGDVFRHANMAGTSPLGGVIAALGDDHTGESSTTLHQSEWTMVDSYMPILSPAGVQEILDYGLFGYALSRYSGLWAGLKCMKDTVEVTSVVNGDPHRLQFVTPEFDLPEGGLNIRLVDTPQEQENRIIHYRRHAAEAFAHANRMDRRVWGKAGAKIGMVAAGKNWLDLQQSLNLLGIDEERANALGITTYKVAMTWPLDVQSFKSWAEGLDVIIVVEEKRKLIEVQIKEAIFNNRHGRRIYGGTREGQVFFADHGALNPMGIAQKIGGLLQDEGYGSDQLSAAMARLVEAERANNAPTLAARLPYFCSGCPHNSSTKLPEGSRAYAGIGCHYMVQWMDRDTLGFTQMGGEGANWIGEAPFSKRGHVFQNLGDGTYNHSGVQAIRAALMAGTNITYKILFNDAVAMTGGQNNDGDLTAEQICREVTAMGVQHVALVHDEKEVPDLSTLPAGVNVYQRSKLTQVQNDFAKIQGVTAIVYAQTCAAEKRRRRKRGTFPDPAKRVMINPDICEGCGDCGVQSNCVSILPLETPLGRKRQIDQSSCNKDFSCVKGFCPSFITIEGGQLKRAEAQEFDLPDPPEPELPAIKGTHNTVITGVGGTGVVTIGAVMAMAAHLDGRAAGMMEMAGLAQKGGAVHIHCRIAEKPEDISAIRVTIGEAHALIGGDLVVSAAGPTLGLMGSNAGGVVNSHEIITGEFTKNTEFQIPGDDLALALTARLQERASLFDASALAERLLGDTVYANMMMLGAAWQQGLVPIGRAAILRAIELNGAKPEENKRAFALGRVAVANPNALPAQPTHSDAVDPAQARRDHLLAYGGKKMLRRFERVLKSAQNLPVPVEEIEKSLHKLLTYKDEYEVARLMQQSEAQVAARFEGDVKLRFHLAPPMLSGLDPDGRPKKREFGAWLLRPMAVLAKMRFLRGTPFDPFGYTHERRIERALIREFESDLKKLSKLKNAHPETVEKLIKLPQMIRGFGPVKQEAAKIAAQNRRQIWGDLTE